MFSCWLCTYLIHRRKISWNEICCSLILVVFAHFFVIWCINQWIRVDGDLKNIFLVCFWLFSLRLQHKMLCKMFCLLGLLFSFLSNILIMTAFPVSTIANVTKSNFGHANQTTWITIWTIFACFIKAIMWV